MSTPSHSLLMGSKSIEFDYSDQNKVLLCGVEHFFDAGLFAEGRKEDATLLRRKGPDCLVQRVAS